MTALSEKGIEIPAKMLPCPYTSVYHDIDMSVYAADKLWACGFRAIDLSDTLGRTPLFFACNNPDEMISWYIDKGARFLEFPRLGIKSYLHVAATALRDIRDKYSITDLKYDLAKLNQFCSPTLTDSCTCYCSSDGCSPVNFFLKNRSNFGGLNWESKSQALYEWLNSGIDFSEQERCCLEACRLEVFERLGMAHTCCQFIVTYPLDSYSKAVTSRERMPEAEQSELQDEDHCAGLVQALQAYMQLYEILRIEYPEPTPIFCKAWWNTLTDLLPERYDGPGIGPGKARGLRKDEEIDAQNRSDDQVSDNVGGDCGPHEKEIRSRMKVLLAGEGLALMEDVFSEDETQ